MKTPAMRKLESLGIPYVVKPHSTSAFTAEDAARERGVRLEQIVKAMVVEKDNGGHCLALIPGDRVLSLKKLARILGAKKVHLLSPTRIFAVTGYQVGAVSPIGVRVDLNVYIDERVLSEELVDISSGRHDAGLELKSADLLRAANAEVCDIVE